MILKSLSLCIVHISSYGLLGPSGCGKTTLLRCIVGLTKVDSGSVLAMGDVPSAPGHSIPGPMVGYMPQVSATGYLKNTLPLFSPISATHCGYPANIPFDFRLRLSTHIHTHHRHIMCMTRFFKKNETTYQLLLGCSSSFNVLAFLLPPFLFYFQEISLYNELTIQEMLYFFGSVHGMTKSDIKHRTAFLLDFLKLPRHPTPVQQLRQGRISVLYRYCNFCKML